MHQKRWGAIFSFAFCKVLHNKNFFSLFKIYVVNVLGCDKWLLYTSNTERRKSTNEQQLASCRSLLCVSCRVSYIMFCKHRQLTSFCPISIIVISFCIIVSDRLSIFIYLYLFIRLKIFCHREHLAHIMQFS